MVLVVFVDFGFHLKWRGGSFIQCVALSRYVDVFFTCEEYKYIL
jgi:hypothetical protein